PEVFAMRNDRHYSRAGRIAPQATAGHLAKSFNKRVPLSKRVRGKRARGLQVNEQLPFVPPEDWYEPREDGDGYRIIVQNPGPGYRHVLTPAEVRARLAELPEHFVRPLEQVQFSRMTRKKQSFPCYGMQWGSTLYLYPIEVDLVECYDQPPKPNQVNEARMYGGRWTHENDTWKLIWTEEAIKDFYLNNILIHELGHLVDDRNTRSVDRERYAEWFAIRYGYQKYRRPSDRQQRANRRHARR
ncbi:MAG TPA: hypothetical protein VG713_09990, partial [Pirellulales bacterium]|nr:hypothetical protein [Pirellulales bacterium]